MPTDIIDLNYHWSYQRVILILYLKENIFFFEFMHITGEINIDIL